MNTYEDAAVTTTFQRPPHEFVDKSGREITIRTPADRDALAAMYVEFDSSDRAQGLPPVGEDRIRDWLDVLDAGIEVVAVHGDNTVGHATLLDCGDGTHELTIFVHADYQLSGIGSQLIRCLLGAGQRGGVDHVWLSVERSNHVAMNLYRKVGFETTSGSGLEHEMELDL
jgi:GNAT superfamily N-acetyltransferase